MKLTVSFINDNNTSIEEKKHNKKDFEKNVLLYLENNQFSCLYILSDFYSSCCEFLELDQLTGDYKSNRRKIQSRLRKMKIKKLIDWRRTGTGFLGKTDTGITSLNSYALYKDWNS